jgi:hypothetical protein
MSSIRTKPRLDEQSFQGLLAAAFTIQQHNDRHGIGAVRRPGGNGLAGSSALQFCQQCGAPVAAGRTVCLNCESESLHSGEHLQHSWASMWEVSQERKSGAHLHKTSPDQGSGSVPAGNGNHLSNAGNGSHISLLALSSPETPGKSQSGSISSSSSSAHPGGGGFSGGGPPDDPPGNDQAPPVTTELMTNGVGWWQKLRSRRAELYLWMAVGVALLALVWPATSSERPGLQPWERLLIAIGIAEAPAPVMHHSGDPNMKVWVDTHTALYYCPGDELYGQSPDGHFTTQGEAQQDRFEPAERSACVE